MTAPRLLIALPIAALAACVPAAPEPTPAPAPAPAPAPPPPAPPVAQPAPAPSFENWMDAPQTPGDWRYSGRSGGAVSIAGFGEGAPVFAISCLDSGSVRLQRLGIGASSMGGAMIVRTEFAERTFPARDTAEGPAIEIPAADPFLEAMAFSKGRFAIETTGAPALFLPAWPEVSRVIEDCRRGPL